MPPRRKNNNKKNKGIKLDENQKKICQEFTGLVEAYLIKPILLMLALISKLEWLFLGNFNQLVTSEKPNPDFQEAVKAGLPIYASPKMDGTNMKIDLAKLSICQTIDEVVACFFFKQEFPFEKQEKQGSLF